MIFCVRSAKSRGEGGSAAASTQEDAGEELKESGGAAAEGAAALPADPAAAVHGGRAHAAGQIPAFPPLREYSSDLLAPNKIAFLPLISCCVY